MIIPITAIGKGFMNLPAVKGFNVSFFVGQTVTHLRQLIHSEVLIMLIFETSISTGHALSQLLQWIHVSSSLFNSINTDFIYNTKKSTHWTGVFTEKSIKEYR